MYAIYAMLIYFTGLPAWGFLNISFQSWYSEKFWSAYITQQ